MENNYLLKKDLKTTFNEVIPKGSKIYIIDENISNFLIHITGIEGVKGTKVVEKFNFFESLKKGDIEVLNG